MGREYFCGLKIFHPKWLQKYANTKIFIIIYGLLGTVLAMSFLYFVVTLTTIEKRFKIPSQTTGLILSGNEISQILFSLILSYIGGQRNRPKWIASGMILCALSCFILATPHFLYGAGNILELTVEYSEKDFNTNMSSLSALKNSQIDSKYLCINDKQEKIYDQKISYVPLILIFLSQVILGIGNTLYYSLGQTYLDDNTKKTDTPLMLAYALSLRMIGPIIGFFLGYLSLNTFIDPTKTPLIDKNDPRWLGAWWLGWIILGTIMIFLSILIAMFPKKLPKVRSKQEKQRNSLPYALKRHNFEFDDDYTNVEKSHLNSLTYRSDLDIPQMKDFSKALIRLLKNKLLILNIISAIFYLLGAAGFITFLTKYMEVQFHKSAQNATIIIGPLTLCGMVIGLLCSGFFISKYKPTASKVLFWNVIVGFCIIFGQITYLFFYCGDDQSLILTADNNISSFTSSCNANCSCNNLSYSPVCDQKSKKIYFSACHAGCTDWNVKQKIFTGCTCIGNNLTNNKFEIESHEISFYEDDFNKSLEFTNINNSSKREKLINKEFYNTLSTTPGICLEDCLFIFYAFSFISFIINGLASSGRIGNILVNYRAVATKDKSFAQGLTLMMISLFGLIPGPVIFGKIIDNTCLIWDQGNCKIYDQQKFRYNFNGIAIGLTVLGLFFDLLVWKYGKNLDLYGDNYLLSNEKKKVLIKPMLS